MAQPKKMGRPLKGDKPLTDRIYVLVDDKTKTKLADCMKSFCKTRSDIVRQGIDMVYATIEK